MSVATVTSKEIIAEQDRKKVEQKEFLYKKLLFLGYLYKLVVFSEEILYS